MDFQEDKSQEQLEMEQLALKEERDRIILELAKDRFKRAEDFWSDVYEKFKEDIHFISDEPNAQWDPRVAVNRELENKTVLSVDLISQYVHQVENDNRKNTPFIEIHPGDKESDVETAQILKGLIKAIEYDSKADAVYDTASSFAVRGGLGFIRVDTEYEGEGFNQKLILKRVVNPTAIFIDPNSINADGSDIEYAFIFDKISLASFREQYPDKAGISFGSGVFDADSVYFSDDESHVVVAEYFAVEKERIEIGLRPDKAIEQVREGGQYLQTRFLERKKIKRYLLSGQDILDEGEFAGEYIPIVPVFGEEVWIEGKRKSYSLFRKAKQAQIRYNYWISIEMDIFKNIPKASIIAEAGTTEEFEEDYRDPDKASVLRYKGTNLNGEKANAPQLLQMQSVSPTVFQASKQSASDVQASMGLYGATVGQRTNETSGIAIQARKQEGDTGTFHFQDNLSRAIEQVGRILVGTIPFYYDTPMIVNIIGEEGTSKLVGINGAIADEKQNKSYNLTVGKYSVRCSTGPSFSTLRQEASNFYLQILQTQPQFLPIISDLVFKYLDIEGAKAISERLKKTVDPKLLEENNSDINGSNGAVQMIQEQANQQMQQAQQVIEQLGKALQEAKKVAEDKQSEAQIKIGELQIKAQSAQTQAEKNQVDTQIKMAELELAREKLAAESALQLQKLEFEKAKYLSESYRQSNVETDEIIPSSLGENALRGHEMDKQVKLEQERLQEEMRIAQEQEKIQEAEMLKQNINTLGEMLLQMQNNFQQLSADLKAPKIIEIKRNNQTGLIEQATARVQS